MAGEDLEKVQSAEDLWSDHRPSASPTSADRLLGLLNGSRPRSRSPCHLETLSMFPAGGTC